MHLSFSSSDPPLGAVLTCKLKNIPFNWAQKTEVPISSSISLSSSTLISRHVARGCGEADVYPSDPLQRSEIDHWLSQSTELSSTGSNFETVLGHLNSALAPSNFLVSNNLTIADLEVFASLYKNSTWQRKVSDRTAPSHVLRWFNFVNHKVSSILSSLPPDVTSSLQAKSSRGKDPTESSGSKRETGGKFVELPGAKMGEVVVRFPPEASGYLHIGHAKAALLNQHYQKAFKGKLIMRFDDTNPDKENTDFEKAILEDLKLLDIEPDMFSFTSDYFDKMLSMCEDLIRRGKAYVDDTDAETMKKERDERKESKNRANPPDRNMKMFEDMKKGTAKGLTCCVRAKIDMTSTNGCMRDPTIYRCKSESHPRTGNKFKVYPTYDFACPIVDSVEGVTHALRTTEYHDRDEQFFWFIENLNLRSLHIYEYSRLNMNNTVLSKRRLTWFVNEGLVDGWDDPRFPTVRGIVRRGMTIEGLKDFILAQGSSRSVVNMEWDKIWSFNKKVIDREASRYPALQGNLIPVNVPGCATEAITAQKHPKDPSRGTKNVWTSSKVWIEKVDALEMVEGQNATFINWGNLMIVKIHRNNGEITSIDAKPNLSDVNYKKTLKLTWLAEAPEAPWTPIVCSYFDHIITKSVLGKDEDFKNFVNHSTRVDICMNGDTELRHLKVGEIIQVQRKGFFRVDEAYEPFSKSTCKESPVVLFYIPDGHSKDNPCLPMNISSKPNNSTSVPVKPVEKKDTTDANDVVSIHNEIKAKGDKIRQLKADKSDKAVIMTEVDILKSLKTKFKDRSGVEWTPDIDMKQFAVKETPCNSGGKEQRDTPDTNDVVSIHNEIKAKGDKIRQLKADKSDKAVIMSEVDILKSLKTKFKESSGVEWTPDIDMKQFEVKETPCNSGEKSALQIHNAIQTQGDKVRKLKSDKADKLTIKDEVNVLLSLKKEFLEMTQVEWKPDIDVDALVKKSSNGINEPANLLLKIKDQGDKIREMKASKADKVLIKTEVDTLLALKKEFKDSTGVEWKPDLTEDQFTNKKSDIKQSSDSDNGNKDILDLNNKVKVQGDKIRYMKESKADKSAIKAEVDVLLSLKANFKNLAGSDWKPDMDLSGCNGSASSHSNPVSNSVNGGSDALQIHNNIKSQGDKVRILKSEKADKNTVTAQVNVLLDLKKQFKEQTGVDWKPDIDPSALSSVSKGSIKPSTVPAKRVSKSDVKETKASKVDDSSSKKQTRLGLEARKLESLPDWYSQVITKSELIEYYNVSGCYILRPWSYRIWELIKDFFDKEIKKLGVENAYFPIFVSKEALEKEKAHLEDFSPEVAWVTKSGSSDLAEPVAIRPTSETVMYPAFAKWIQSHRDLPIKINQWNNVVRWEFKQPTPFLRTREFLWQEGHTAFATKEEAVEEVHTIANLYAQVYEDLLAIPVVKGKKTVKEKFAGADFTITTEAFISASGRGIQGATSHHLGQNFAKMVDIVFDDPKTQEKKYVYQNSWGLTTRTIGVMVMVHGDDKGLVLPPVVAPIQVVVMPVGITATTTDDVKNNLIKYCSDIANILNEKEIRCKCDLRDNVTPAWKFNHWELKGVPIRLEIGPRELNENKVFAVRRDTGEKASLDRVFIERRVFALLETIYADMFNKAKVDLDTHICQVCQWTDFVEKLNLGNMLLAPFCGEEDCEDEIKKNSAREEQDSSAPAMGAKSLCIPFDQPGSVNGLKCIYPTCKKSPQFYTLFGRSY